MRLRDGLCLGLSFSALACARPSLGVEGDGELDPTEDAGQQDADTGVEISEDSRVPEQVEHKDASTPVVDANVVEDAGCADADDDGVCDAVDNCPNVANADQANADRDDTGDACEPITCNGETIPNGVEIDDTVRLNNVKINSKVGTLATVEAGSSVTIDLAVQFTACGGPFSGAPIYISIENGSRSGSDCKPALCSDYTTPTMISLPLQFSVTAPVAEGLHYVLAGLGSVTCGAGADLTRLAALCVTPKL